MKLYRLLLIFLLIVFVARIALTYRVFNDTTDEQGHIVAGLEMLQRGKYTFEAQHPPLARVVVAALPYKLAGFRREGYWLWGDGPWSRAEPSYYWLTLSLARAGNLIFAALVFVLVYRWSSLLYGAWAGVIACLLIVCSPTVLAHAGLATLDIAGAATVLMAAYFFWRWSEHPGWRYCVASGLAFGIAVLSKFSALVFLPPMLGIFLVTARWKTRSRLWRLDLARVALSRAVAFGLLTALVIWAGYLFEVGSIVPPGHRYHSMFPMGGESSFPQRLARAVETKMIPAPQFFQGLIDLSSHNRTGHQSYLLGKTSHYGWWYYFPVAVAVKTTLPLLMLVAAGLWFFVFRREVGGPPGTIFPILATVVVMGVSMSASINIGVRHVLAIYPFFAILASGAFQDLRLRRPSAVTLAGLGLVGWHVAESVAAHPDYLPYFNQIARGREERFLADSNLDWGQDLARLGRYMRQHHIEDVQLSYFGPTDPRKMGVAHRALSWEPGWMAVSVNHVLGIDAHLEHHQWLRSRKPDDQVGKSIWLYHLSPSEIPAPAEGRGHGRYTQ